MTFPSETFVKLAPFALRSGIVVTGRGRLGQLRKRLAFILVTTDISPRSEREMVQQFPCPVVTCLTSADIEALFGFRGTKVIGFMRSPLAQSLLKACKDSTQEEQDDE